jgi:hypothetical protein
VRRDRVQDRQGAIRLLRQWRLEAAKDAFPWPYWAMRTQGAACREAFRRVRRDVWSERESRLVAKWESYG